MLTQIIETIAVELTDDFSIPVEQVVELFEIPKELSHGHLAIPVFLLARTRKKAPPLIAKEISEKMLTKNIPSIARIEPVGGYVNFHLKDSFLLKTLYEGVQKKGERYGYRVVGAGRSVVIDYSSPNVAKPMHVGHLRATVIGQAIRNLAETQGYKVIGLNHLGDWGVQFGKLALAFKRWGKEYPFEAEPFESLYKLYVRFHEEAEKDPELEKQGSLTFKNLEEGDPELHKLWQRFVDISMKDFDRQWQRLGVRHDLVRGESFYNDRLKSVEKQIEDKGLLVESDGAMVVDLQDEKMPPCLIRKGDGASLYATRDIASAVYRMEELKADLNLYVVGQEQTLHFKQVFSVLRRMGFKWWDRCHHISFGMYRFKDAGKMSSRKGQIIRLEDLLNQAIEDVKKFMTERVARGAGTGSSEAPSPTSSGAAEMTVRDIDRVSEQVAIGAIVFNDLINDRVRDVDFDWEKALSFEGDSGPYLQYVHVRCHSILRKYGLELPKEFPREASPLTSPSERELVKTLLRYEEVLRHGFEQFRPNILATYLLDVSAAFNRFYHDHRIIGGEKEYELSRVILVYITREVIRGGLRVLNIQAPQVM